MHIRTTDGWFPAKPFVKINGVWRECTEVFVRQEGEWKSLLSNQSELVMVHDYTLQVGSWTITSQLISNARCHGYERGEHGSITPGALYGLEFVSLYAGYISELNLYSAILTLEGNYEGLFPVDATDRPLHPKLVIGDEILTVNQLNWDHTTNTTKLTIEENERELLYHYLAAAGNGEVNLTFDFSFQ